MCLELVQSGGFDLQYHLMISSPKNGKFGTDAYIDRVINQATSNSIVTDIHSFNAILGSHSISTRYHQTRSARR